ncbi:LacI family DNA-binding transcriptional regulator [Pseudomonas sp. N40(2020)]|uniref:LacI family DNA-binding transcriptional regulator n=1 Tax=Pseudomonas sp. N40(2020) TaxID=2767798 RepID=UPI001656D909|nr:LacI family DNA-binding transcriptional regulator [Pseudomonas sp. N40(2020)]MBC8996810.1 LacI family DNA-binding transcriptional regulator [Pseudomonas sp. N40(2020)]
MNKKKTVTVSDIAKRVNMTTTTVSRALSKPNLVKPATLAKILEVARELDYVPNTFARGLKRSESLIIGVITASVDNPFYSEMIKAISREAKKHGYTIMLLDTDKLEDLENSAVATLLGYRVAGIILSPVSDEPDYQPDYLERLSSGKTPVVLLDRTIHDSPFSRVVLDNYDSGLKAAQYLLAHAPSMKRLLVLTGPKHSRITVERLKGLHAVLAEHPTVQVDIYPGDYTLEPSYQNTLAYLQDRSAPDAIIGFNQLITLGALKALRARNIPQDSITICGIDRLPFADIFGIPIACVVHDASLAGSSAVQMLLDRLANPQKSRDKVVIAGELENG